ncbi:sigma-70 family RNA polymerase sigma factor [Conexibacter sp. CPCC 206217]|uniref:sigma-70 family RNA polymerase sigma factor n=1 Tax=Conexibacter sp. CPCC 206217 TaxID=3064574 RepID=UPI002723BA8E|nr:sigma-70 family RNA polymerase sigma factor [Conexibacter sp. CPCC 206217]MDO8208997.1 sigma-70 family RNA polymerase sigma factor [Conexibacter sp. CPCC 206217]
MLNKVGWGRGGSCRAELDDVAELRGVDWLRAASEVHARADGIDSFGTETMIMPKVLRPERGGRRRRGHDRHCTPTAGTIQVDPAAAERRRQAEALIEAEYEAIKPEVIKNARAKLAARGLYFPKLDLEGWYNAAWHGLFRTIVDSDEQIENPGGWLVVTMVRRALDDVRHTRPEKLARLREDSTLAEGVVEPDYAQELDDLDRIRKWRTGLRVRLNRREREAAALHLIHGYSRIETARMLGVPTRRADKIFDSITSKTAGLLRAIEDGTWCDEQRSLMTAYAAGILDPDGERHAIAVQHLGECAGCTAFVRSLRVAYVVVPAPALLGVGGVLGGGALGAALGVAEVSSSTGAAGGVGAGLGAGGAAFGLGGATVKTAVVCLSAVCVGSAGIVVEQVVRDPAPKVERRIEERARRSASSQGTSTTSNATINTTVPSSTTGSSQQAPPPSEPSHESVPTARAKRRVAKPRVDERQQQQRQQPAAEQQESEIGIESAASEPTQQSPPPSTATASAASTSQTGSSSQTQASSAHPARPSGAGGGLEIGIEP